MATMPTLETSRLILRPFTPADASDVQRLAGAKEVAATMLRLPHPYEDGMAEQWISTHQESFDRGQTVDLAITLRDGGTLVGCVGLILNMQHKRGELGYWVGVPYWGKGYCTEAVEAMVRYAFEVLCLNRVYAWHMVRNPASGRVMQKVGMKPEGVQRQQILKLGRFEDVASYGLLRSEYRL